MLFRCSFFLANNSCVLLKNFISFEITEQLPPLNFYNSTKNIKSNFNKS
jgi:hypothetical protein